MFKIYLSIFFLNITLASFAQQFKPIDEGSKVHFVIKNFVINTGGDIAGLQGDINFIAANATACKFNISVAVGTIDTDNNTRDKHLKGKDYFDAEKYPSIILVSTKITKTNKINWYFFTGNLTIHGVTKVISFPFTATLKGNDYLFAGAFEINRLDFGVGKSSSILSNTVKVYLSVLTKKN